MRCNAMDDIRTAFGEEKKRNDGQEGGTKRSETCLEAVL